MRRPGRPTRSRPTIESEVAGRRIAPAGTVVENRAFDITPSALATALITEDGVRRPSSLKFGVMDLVALYSDSQSRIIDLVSPLAPPALASRVPGTPRWNVGQLVAHLSGVCADLADGVVDGVASEPWTDRQVSSRQDRPLPGVLAEWRARTPTLLEMLAEPGKVDASAFDILTHEHDLRGALGLAGPSDRAAVVGVTTRVTGRVSHMIKKAGLPTLRLVSDETEWVCGPCEGGKGSDAGVRATASTMEWFRALFGRRSAAQVLTYSWEGDPAPYFGLLNLFGPLPEGDVAEAGAPVGGGVRSDTVEQ